jgi:hypothetical protein
MISAFSPPSSSKVPSYSSLRNRYAIATLVVDVLSAS